MRIIQSSSFEKTAKKLDKPQKLQLDDAIRAIIRQPFIGSQKKGDLREVYVHKFKIDKRQFLLAYRFKPDTLELIMLGQHENYYRRLSAYLKGR